MGKRTSIQRPWFAVADGLIDHFDWINGARLQVYLVILRHTKFGPTWEGWTVDQIATAACVCEREARRTLYELARPGGKRGRVFIDLTLHPGCRPNSLTVRNHIKTSRDPDSDPSDGVRGGQKDPDFIRTPRSGLIRTPRSGSKFEESFHPDFLRISSGPVSPDTSLLLQKEREKEKSARPPGFDPPQGAPKPAPSPPLSLDPEPRPEPRPDQTQADPFDGVPPLPPGGIMALTEDQLRARRLAQSRASDALARERDRRASRPTQPAGQPPIDKAAAQEALAELRRITSARRPQRQSEHELAAQETDP